MTADSPANRTTSGRSVNSQRALKLLRAGLTGGLIATALAVVAGAIAFGGWGALTALIAAVAVLAFYCIGQGVMVMAADFPAVKLMAISMGSYIGRVIGVGLLLVLFQKKAAEATQLVAPAFAIGTVAVVVGWVAVEIWVFRRMRIAIYDTEYVPPQAAVEGGASR